MQGDLLRAAAGAKRFARVVLPLPVDRAFTYEVPAEMADGVFVGCRVEVPFGRRVLSGVITELTDDSDVPRTRPIRSLYETYLPDPLIEISQWIASYYGCTVGEAMQAVLPPSLKRSRVTPRPTGLVRVCDATLVGATADSDAVAGARGALSRARKQLALLLELAAAGGESPLPAITGEWGYARSVVDALVEKGHVSIQASVPAVSPLQAMDAEVTALTRAQEEALARVTQCIASGGFHPVLLNGVTGSGKTEVYLRAARAVLAAGGGCIVLVPEIGLIPQATARYRRMFGEAVAIIHSRLTGPERFEIWEKVVRGDFRIVVGPRSAVFSPVRDLRMIIVDEEQDDSYKQDDKPRYHARAVALMRGKKEGLAVVLGSATPSAESFYHAREGRYTSLRLHDRVRGVPMPEIQLVDMREETDKSSFFSQALVDRLDENIRAGQQSIIFLNRRGHARYVQCRSCGWVATCQSCDISLTYHRVDSSLKCHFCGFARPSVSQCDTCRGRRLSYSGVGTQRVELDLRTMFPDAGILRMDADTTSGKEGHQRILEEFSTGDYPILMGTQMVAKGHHFPGVSLVGVLFGEEGLNFPDFRSAERTFQMLTQVSGRAGRGRHPGDVVVQTFVPEHYVFNFLQRHDYDGFMHEELAIRQRLSYPPFSRIALASMSSPDAGALQTTAHAWVHELRRALDGRSLVILGPTEPLVARIKNRYRQQVLIKGAISSSDKDLALRAWEQVVAGRRRGTEMRWDVDPESFL